MTEKKIQADNKIFDIYEIKTTRLKNLMQNEKVA